MGKERIQPVILATSYSLAHTPGLVRHGSKPSREIHKDPTIMGEISAHLRSYEDAVSYAPNRAFLGSIYPDDLRHIEQPWYRRNGDGGRSQPHGDILPEEELYGLLKISDSFDLVSLEEGFAGEVKEALAGNPLVQEAELDRLQTVESYSEIEARVADPAAALPLYLRDGRLVGSINRAHSEDPTLTPDILLENLTCKATAVMALRSLLADANLDPEGIGYIMNTGEEAVGERYQRGGGNLAKAIGEMCGLNNATGSDIKAFCCGPVHALVMAGALVSSGVFRQVVVVGGCSLAKLGMKFQGHLKNEQPILEDVLASLAILVGEDDGVSPVIRLDGVGRHTVGAGSSQQAIFEKLVTSPLKEMGMELRDVDKYATELHNPEVTEPAGSGNVPRLNYQLIAALAVLNKEITRSEMSQFAETHGMPGYSPTQGHIASAVPFMGHALDQIKNGRMERVLFLAKGSLFLGRMTQMSDGISFLLERNPAS